MEHRLRLHSSPPFVLFEIEEGKDEHDDIDADEIFTEEFYQRALAAHKEEQEKKLAK